MSTVTVPTKQVQIGKHNLPFQIAPTMSGSLIWVLRDECASALYSAAGHMIGYGVFPSLDDVVKSVSHFLTVHPDTHVITIPRFEPGQEN